MKTFPKIKASVKVVDWRDVSRELDREKIAKAVRERLNAALRKIEDDYEGVALSWSTWMED